MGGFRTDIIEALRRLKPPIIRWPGGCFADDYHWQDGIGPRDQRPAGSTSTGAKWSKPIMSAPRNLSASVAWLALNRIFAGTSAPALPASCATGSNTAISPILVPTVPPGRSSRAADGSPEPLNVTYWGVGNENWGCGGNFSPEDYCTEFRRYASFVRGFGKKLFVIACGPASNDVEWTDRFFRKLNKDYWAFNNIDGFAAHYYCGTAGTATEYTEEEFYRLLEKGLRARMIASVRFRSPRSTAACASPARPPMPGIIDMTWPSGPIFCICCIESSMSSRVKVALRSFSSSLAACFWSTCSWARSTSVRMSPIPRIRPASRSGWNSSSASVFSPVPRNLTGRPVTARDRERGAAARVAVDLGQDEAGQRDGRRERLGDADRLLAGHGIDDEQGLDRLDRGVDRRDLGHQLLVEREAAGGVEDHHVTDLPPGRLDPAADDVDDGGPDGRPVDRDVEGLAERLELVGGGRAVRVGGHEQRPPSELHDVAGELGGRGRLARALQADERHDGRVAAQVERPVAGRQRAGRARR